MRESLRSNALRMRPSASRQTSLKFVSAAMWLPKPTESVQYRTSCIRALQQAIPHCHQLPTSTDTSLATKIFLGLGFLQEDVVLVRNVCQAFDASSASLADGSPHNTSNGPSHGSPCSPPVLSNLSMDINHTLKMCWFKVNVQGSMFEGDILTAP